MKKIIFKILLLQLFILCNIERGNCQNSRNELGKNQIFKVIITSVDFDIETPGRIDCKHFYSYFNNVFRKKEIRDCKTISKILNYINEAKNNNQKAFPVDVRFRIKIYYSDDTVIEVCGNDSVMEIDGKQHIINRDFLNYLKILLK